MRTVLPFLKSSTAAAIITIMFLLNTKTTAQTRIDTILQNIEDTAGTVRIGLVLAGGGAKGLAHIGVIKVLEEEGVHVDYVGGTSMGGLIGGLYAVGNNSEDLKKIVSKMNWNKLLNDGVERKDLPIDEKKDLSTYLLSLPLVGFVPNLPRGLKKGQLVYNEITKQTWAANDIGDFADLPIPFYCIATDIENGQEVLLDHGSLPTALRSTMSIPSVFEPVLLDGRMLVDGGLVNNFPVDDMRKKGMNFIIGVDVGANLYKKEEISSIVEILDQASSFYGQSRLNYNKSITDLYIRPDITGLSTLDFGKTDEIVKRGEDAARAHIEEIRAIARYIKKHGGSVRVIHKLNTTDTVYINKINVNGNLRNSKKIVYARLNLKTPAMHSLDDINNSINRVYYSGYFDKVTYSLSNNGEGYTLSVNVEEKHSNLFRAGGHYDSYTQASLLLNIKLLNFLIDGSKTNLSFTMGPNPAIDIAYMLDQGKFLGYGLTASYHTKELFTYDNLFINPASSYFFSFTTLDFSAYTNYSSTRRFMIGADFNFFNIKSNVSVVPNFEHNIPIFNFYVKYLIDTYDDANYPEKGVKLSFRANQSAAESHHPMTFLKADIEGTIPAAKTKLFFQPGVFIGASFGNIGPYPYRFIIGGMGQNYIANMVPFAGMQYTSYFEQNAIIVRCKIRWNFAGKHNFFVIGNAGSFNDIFESMFLNSKLYYGGAIGYSLKSLIGPIEVSYSSSNQGPYGMGFLNIGYWF